MTFTRNTSYVLLAIAVIATGYFKIGALFLSVLFSYFALSRLKPLGKRWLILLVFFIVVALIFSGIGFMIDQAVHNLPKAAMAAIPSIAQFAKEKNLELPFSDWDSLKAFALDSIKDQLPYVGNFTRTALKQFALVLVGIVVAVSLFLSPKIECDQENSVLNNLYSAFWCELSARFRSFYTSFTEVMKAQLIIATINCGMTGMFLVSTSMPYSAMLVVITFLCGLLPIIGNLISNSIIVGVGFTVSPKLGIGALIFLVVLHKFEYFLNSKIIGQRIKNPVWLTLIALIVGERILGITGIILAPVFLHFFRMEASQIEVTTRSQKEG